MRIRFCFIVLLLSFFCYPVFSQLPEDVLPIKGTTLLSGSFGELRGTHFHSGIDIKTGGREGLPVVCVNDGVLVRILVSSTGYGKALYVEHENGTMTVYAHLQRFNDEINTWVRKRQYELNSFSINEDVREAGIVLKRGDTIAFSGNSGSSGGPHLHIEYRDAGTEQLLNPLKYIPIKDKIAPMPRALYLYSVSEQGVVERMKRLVPKKSEPNKYSLGKVVVPEGNVGIGVYVTDAMNDSWNKLGVYGLELSVNEERYFTLSMDSSTFNSRRLINEIKDYSLYNREKETVYQTFGFYMEKIPGVSLENKGFVEVKEGTEQRVKMKFSDYNGNLSELDLILQGGKRKASDESNTLRYDSSYLLQAGDYSVQLGSEVLFYSVPKVERTDTFSIDGRLYTAFVITEENQPLLQNVQLRVKGNFDARELICQITDDYQFIPCATYREDGYVYASVNCLGKYTVAMDTVSPVVEYLGVEKGYLRFKITDDFSGINFYRGEVNGSWCLFEYDAKNNLYFCRVTEPVFSRSTKNKINLTVKDGVGNETTAILDVFIN